MSVRVHIINIGSFLIPAKAACVNKDQFPLPKCVHLNHLKSFQHRGGVWPGHLCQHTLRFLERSATTSEVWTLFQVNSKTISAIKCKLS